MNIKSYVLSITAVVLISQICELLLPSGKMKSATKTVFSLMIILIFISPIINFFGGNANFDFNIDKQQVSIDSDFGLHAQSVRDELIKDKVENVLNKLGITGAKIVVDSEIYGNLSQIKNVTINLKNSVIIENGAHINKTEVSQTVASTLGIDEGRIKVIE